MFSSDVKQHSLTRAFESSSISSSEHLYLLISRSDVMLRLIEGRFALCSLNPTEAVREGISIDDSSTSDVVQPLKHKLQCLF
jgi:hypothetical protein